MTNDRLFGTVGAGLALMGVAGGAFGAHALESRLSPDMLTVFDTGVRYHMYHALALLAVSLYVARHGSTRLFAWAGSLFVAGTVVFSGSLYALALSGMTWLGAITPIGGACFLAGWTCFAVAIWQHPSAEILSGGAPKK